MVPCAPDRFNVVVSVNSIAVLMLLLLTLVLRLFLLSTILPSILRLQWNSYQKVENMIFPSYWSPAYILKQSSEGRQTYCLYIYTYSYTMAKHAIWVLLSSDYLSLSVSSDSCQAVIWFNFWHLFDGLGLNTCTISHDNVSSLPASICINKGFVILSWFFTNTGQGHECDLYASTSWSSYCCSKAACCSEVTIHSGHSFSTKTSHRNDTDDIISRSVQQ